MAAPPWRICRDGDCHSVSFIDDCRDALPEAWRRSAVECGVRHCRIRDAPKAIGVTLPDRIIVTPTAVLSFRTKGLL